MADVTPGKAVTVSLQQLTEGSVSFETLTEAFGPSSLGVIIVKDLPEKFKALRSQVLSNASYLASLPEDELESLTSAEAKFLVGWSGHTTSIVQNAPADEFPDFPQYTAPNIWPPADRLPTFRQSLTELCTLIIDTAVLVARACDRYAEHNIEEYKPGYLEHVVKTSMTSKARLLHYFPAPAEDPAQTPADASEDDDWCGTHLDHGCLTGLTSAMFVDEAAHPPEADTSKSAPIPELPTSPDPKAGLYIRSRTGDVVKVNIPKDCLAFQTGEALEVITKGKFKAVPHFVKGAKTQGPARIARNTLAVFTQPNLGEEVMAGKSFADFAREVVDRNH
ncbi:hypothetical protein LOZ03_001301 [Ophidiomyces ophidiicola]|nr:hypothetical protein LOZ03_001301 [Ophidiomyces ophidiicola]